MKIVKLLFAFLALLAARVGTSLLPNVPLQEQGIAGDVKSSNSQQAPRNALSSENPDGTCVFRMVFWTDSCDSLASKCGISIADFSKVNPRTDLCSTLKIGQLVCCSDGMLPGSNEIDDDPDYEDDRDDIDLGYWSDCPEGFILLLDTIPDHCFEQYMLEIQIAILDTSMQKYKDLMDHDYDEKFGDYEEYAKAQVPDQLNNFMASDKVDKYFKCRETKDVECCKDCYKGACRGPCEEGDTCQSGSRTVDMDECPKYEFEAPPLSSGFDIPNATFSLADSEGFYADILSTWGIDESWITFGKRRVKIVNGCQYDPDVLACEERQFKWFYDFPLATNIQIYNPKQIIQDAYPTASDLLGRVKLVATFSTWDESTQLTDMVDAMSMPAFTLQQAVESMQNITKKADEITKQEREQFILNFLSSVLFLIPIAGEAAGAAGLATIGNLLRLIGVTGETGMLIHDLIADPQNAYISIFAYLAGAGVGNRGFGLAAASRRGMKAADIDRLGSVKLQLDNIETVRARTC